MELWRSFWRLSKAERKLALEAGAALAGAWLGVRVTGPNDWRARFESLGACDKAENLPADVAIKAAREITRLANAAARHLPLRTTCLERALATRRMLRRRGIRAELRIGARKNAAIFEAHAWLEVCGMPIADEANEVQGFVPFEDPLESLRTQSP
jgi:hypothetical protein